MPAPGTAATMWDAEPPRDPAGEARNAEIDSWLKNERAIQIARDSKTLVLSPPGESFDDLKNRVVLHLGSQVDLSDGRKIQVMTDSFGPSDKKRMSGMEPQVLLYVVDPGTESQVDDAKLVTRMTKALSHFMFIARNMGLTEGCAVVILVARFALIQKSAEGSAKESWERLYPSLKIGENLRGAIEAEFESTANAHSNPLQGKVVFDDNGFEDLSFLRGVLQESVDDVIQFFENKAGTGDANETERFHDATEGSSSALKQRQQIAADAPPETRRERLALWMSRLLFGIELALFIFAFGAGIIPWEEVTKFVYLVMDTLRIPRLF